MMLTKIRTVLDSVHSFLDEYQDFGSNVTHHVVASKTSWVDRAKGQTTASDVVYGSVCVFY
jgi:hypothetical protein